MIKIALSVPREYSWPDAEISNRTPVCDLGSVRDVFSREVILRRKGVLRIELRSLCAKSLFLAERSGGLSTYWMSCSGIDMVTFSRHKVVGNSLRRALLAKCRPDCMTLCHRSAVKIM